MKLIELTRISGTKFSVNPNHVVYVVPSTDNVGTYVAMPYGNGFSIKEEYNTVIRLLTDEGAPTAWGGPR